MLSDMLSRRDALTLLAAGLATRPTGAAAQGPARRRPYAVAHRGASAYAPEHTLAAYQLALDQGAEFVEQDLAMTRDGVLICLHDDSLERTTDVAEVFPDRATTEPGTGRRRWLAVDFTLDEVRRLDAGQWFGSGFHGARVPTWEEAVELVRGRAGLYPELKMPALYVARGLDMTAAWLTSLRRLDLLATAAEQVIVQSFDDAPLRRLAVDLPRVARTMLVDRGAASRWLTPDGLRAVAEFATGIGPAKPLVEGRPDLVAAAHDIGLGVTPYTFSTRAPAPARPDLTEEIRYYLEELGVDAVFTDNPDRFPRTPLRA